MNVIDTDEDHYVRSIDINHVYNMCIKASTMDDGSTVVNPTFTQIDYPQLYNNCICGHAIEFNHMATCEQTGKSFVVGSKCIVTVCNLQNWRLTAICCYCKSIKMKTKKYCKDCSKRIKSTIKMNDFIITFGTKYIDKKFIDIYNRDKRYIEWVKSKDMPESQTAFKTFKQWIISLEKYKDVIDEYIEHK
jgi:hypothetical protein